MIAIVMYIICWYNTGLLTCAYMAQSEAKEGKQPVTMTQFFGLSLLGPVMTIIGAALLLDEGRNVEMNGGDDDNV